MMKYAVAYEISSSDVSSSLINILLCLLLLLLSIAIIIFNIIKAKKMSCAQNQSGVVHSRSVKNFIFSLFGAIIGVLIMVAIFINFLNFNEYIDEKKYYSEYQKGNYSVVSGKITDLQTTSEFFDTPDKYYVNGVYFYHYYNYGGQFDPVGTDGYIHKKRSAGENNILS
jgi:preprotein translocase subunit SecG